MSSAEYPGKAVPEDARNQSCSTPDEERSLHHEAVLTDQTRKTGSIHGTFLHGVLILWFTNIQQSHVMLIGVRNLLRRWPAKAREAVKLLIRASQLAALSARTETRHGYERPYLLSVSHCSGVYHLGFVRPPIIRHPRKLR